MAIPQYAFVAAAALILGASSGASAQEDSFTAPDCTYRNDRTDRHSSGPCRLRSTTLNGNFADTLTFRDGARVSVEYVDHQGGYHRLKINGQPAFGYETDPNSLRAATLDLKQIVEWGR